MTLQRTIEFVLALFGVLLLSPVLLLLGALVWVRTGRPVLHIAARVGKDGRPFALYKFRTMVPGSAARGSAVTVKDDPRVTGVGAVLRRHKLDELPQLLNVIKGDMSLVGPRPEDPKYVETYTRDQRKVLSVRPGVTSPASLAFRSEEEMLAGPDWESRYVQEILPEKLRIEIAYLDKRSMWSDLLLIGRTVATILMRR